MRIRGENGELFPYCGADQQSIKGVAVMKRKAGSPEGVSGLKRDDLQTMLDAGLREPVNGRHREVEFSGSVFLADLKGIHRRNEQRPTAVPQRLFGSATQGRGFHDEPQDGACVQQDHRAAAGQSSSVAVSSGS